jgi:hypothetical protein
VNETWILGPTPRDLAGVSRKHLEHSLFRIDQAQLCTNSSMFGAKTAILAPPVLFGAARFKAA